MFNFDLGTPAPQNGEYFRYGAPYLSIPGSLKTDYLWWK